jgi:hypothetical protein
MKLRFGVMCSGTTLRAWQVRCLDALAEVPDVELALLIVDDRSTPEPRTALGRMRRRPNLVWDAYNNLYVARRSHSLRRVDASERLADTPTIRCEVERRGKWSEYFSESDVAAIAEHQLDFALRFAFGIIRGDILEVPRFGVWSFHHDDEERYRGGPPAFWELVHGDTVTGAVLQRLTERLDGGVVLHKGYFRTAAHSYVRNTDEVHFGSAEWPAKVCRELQQDAAEYVFGEPTSSDAPIYRKPSNWRMTRFLASLAATFVRTQARRLVVADQWNVGVVDAPIQRFLEPDFSPQVRWWPRARERSRYIADPFGGTVGDRRFVLVESYDYRSRLGTIDWLPDVESEPSDGSGGGTALRLADHASYPFVLAHDGELFCIPQLSPSAGVHLFRATEFPVAWERVAVIAEGVRALDPTIVQHEGLWWMFFTDAREGPLTKLRVWHAEDLLGSWRPHAGNPVKTDVRSARPAGTPFVHEGVLYRPAQDCSRTYGGAVTINRVLTLSPTEFREEVVRVVHPVPASGYERGLHTLAAFDGATLVDGKRHVFNRHATMTELRARLRRRPQR